MAPYKFCPAARRAFALVAVGLALAGALGAAPAHAAPTLEVRARTAFIAGRYDEAVELYSRLYGESLHPVYLRNLGRCHQKLGNAERATEFFEQYLKQEPSIKEDERQEILGYIQDMRELKAAQKRSGLAQTPPERGTQPGAAQAGGGTKRADAAAASPPGPLPSSAPPVTASSRPSPVVGSLSTAADAEGARPIYQQWWLWTGIGVVAAGVATALLISRPETRSRPPCPSTAECK
jgi:tetratricopeptide (TPR) repeat protein